MLLAILAALFAQASPVQPAPASAKAFPFPVEMHTLPNGLRVGLVTYDSPGLVAYYTLMRVGSRNEVEKGRSGYAHFFEHMMFTGTKKYPAREYDRIVTGLGLNTNAFTDDDETVYHLYGPAKALPKIIELEADRFQNLEYTESAFRTEAGAILGEYLKSASNPVLKLYETMQATAYTTHTYRHTTIGFLEDIRNMPAGYEYSREFFRRYYTPDNAIVFVVGDFDKPATLALIEKAYGGWKGKLDPARVPAEPRQSKSKRAEVRWDKPTLPRLWIAWHSPAASDVKTAALQNLLGAYLFGPTSPLYQNLILSKQVVESMRPTYSDHRDPTLFGVMFQVKDPRNLRLVETSVLREIKAIAGGKVDAKRMDDVRSNLRYSNIMELDTADAAAQSLAVNAALTGDPDYLNREFAALAALKTSDLQNFVKAYMKDLNRTTVTLVSAAGGKR